MVRTARARLVSGARVLACLALLAGVAACGSAPPPGTPDGSPTAATPAAGGKLTVVATTTQIRSMAEAVAGDRAAVRSILKAGADPHDYEPLPSDVRAISHSALVLRNGIGLDSWLDKLIAGAGGTGPVVTVSTGVPVRKGDESEPLGDPHIWFSVANAMTMTRTIRDALVQVDPAGGETYQANATAYLARLDALDMYIKTQIAGIPAGQRQMVTNHDAFGYYIERYGLTFVGSIIPAMSTEAAPSAQDVAALIAKIRATHVKAIFLESSINPKLAQQIGSEAGVQVVDTLYGDSLGAPGTPGATYEGMMRYDTDTIVTALK